MDLGNYTMYVGIPYFDWTAESIAWTYLEIPAYSTTNQQEAGFNNSLQLLQSLQDLVADCPGWERVYYQYLNNVYMLSEGLNSETIAGPDALKIDISPYGGQVSQDWFPSDYGNYGYVRWKGANGGNEHIDWIQSQAYLSVADPQQQYAGFDVFLQPGLAGTATGLLLVGVPPLQYRWVQPPPGVDNAWHYYNSHYPYYGPLPQLPTF